MKDEERLREEDARIERDCRRGVRAKGERGFMHKLRSAIDGH